MKMIILSVAFAMPLLSSLVPIHNKAALPVVPKQSKQTGVAWQVDETYVENYREYYFCNASEVVFPELTVTINAHGVDNGNVSTIHALTTVRGRGYNPVTNEQFVLDDQVRAVRITPIKNGTRVSNYDFRTVITGDQGHKYELNERYIVRFDVNGETKVDKYFWSGACE